MTDPTTPPDVRERKIGLAREALANPYAADGAERARVTTAKDAAHAVLFGEAMADLASIARSLETIAHETTRVRRDGLNMKGGR